MLFYNDQGLAGKTDIQDPSFDCIVKDYCGITLSELVKKDDSEYETRVFWTEAETEPTIFRKVFVEMLHLAYTRGGEL